MELILMRIDLLVDKDENVCKDDDDLVAASIIMIV